MTHANVSVVCANVKSQCYIVATAVNKDISGGQQIYTIDVHQCIDEMSRGFGCDWG